MVRDDVKREEVKVRAELLLKRPPKREALNLRCGISLLLRSQLSR